jgi:hypothetical protein
MPRAMLASLVFGLLAGCVYGPTVDKFPLARRPEGVAVDASSPHGPFAGELLEVRDTGLLILLPPERAAGKPVVLLPYGAIRTARFGRLGAGYGLKDGQTPVPATRERLRRVSRFPQGLSDAVLRRLLDACGQAEVEKVPE